jgi:hypothetical protein
LSSWLETLNAGIICVSETWLQPNVKSSEVIDTSNFVVFRKDRDPRKTKNGKVSTRGGGVLLAIKSKYKPRKLHNLENNSDIICAEVIIKHFKILVACVYISNTNSDLKNEGLLSAINNGSNLHNKYEGVIVTGDFNLQIDWSENIPRACNLLSSTYLSCFMDFVPH